MTKAQTYRYIILPQSIRFMLPPMTGEVVHMIKSSAIVSVIAVAELTTIGRNIISDTYMSFEIWFTIAAGLHGGDADPVHWRVARLKSAMPSTHDQPIRRRISWRHDTMRRHEY